MVVQRRNDRGFRNFTKNTRVADGSELQVGIFERSRAVRSSLPGSAANSLAYRYAIHDQGRGNNPKRETLRPAINDAIRNDRFVQNFLNGHVGDSPSRFRLAVKQAGLRASARVKREITRLKQPKKKPATINAIRSRYGGTRQNPLVVTGEMRNAVDFRYKR